VKSEAEVEED